MNQTQTGAGVRAFDFLVGSWEVHNYRLKELLVGNDGWYEFPATLECRSILEGQGNLDAYSAPDQGFSGMTLRLFDQAEEAWSIYWANSRKGILEPPVVGRFDADQGDFYGEDTYDGRPIRVHFVWSLMTPTSARWEQAFSPDGGETWETNWIMELTRTGS